MAHNVPKYEAEVSQIIRLRPKRGVSKASPEPGTADIFVFLAFILTFYAIRKR
jgi:hypothetical protein